MPPLTSQDNRGIAPHEEERSMPRWITLLVVGLFSTTLVPAQPPAADEEREKQVAERFLSVLEKNPRRGTALDRVYGYHVERGTLENLLKTYRDRVAKDDKDGT